MRYLLDTNICAHLARGKFGIGEKLKQIGLHNCCISVITKIELLYGAECSMSKEKNKAWVNALCESVEVLPLSDDVINRFCELKVKLRKSGFLVDDFDLLIATTSISGDCIMVTENEKHFSRIDGIIVENWVIR